MPALRLLDGVRCPHCHLEDSGAHTVKIAVAGCGYVGLSIATLLAQRHEVVALDIDKEKVAAVNAGRSPIVDPELTEYLASERLQLRATTSATEALAGARFVVIATPTDYRSEEHTSELQSRFDLVC